VASLVAAEQVFWRVAGTAMRQPLHKIGGTERTHPILLLIKACLRRTSETGKAKTAIDKSASRDARALRYAILKAIPAEDVARFLAKHGLDRCAQQFAAHVKAELQRAATKVTNPKTEASSENRGDLQTNGADIPPADTVRSLPGMPPIPVKKIAMEQFAKLRARRKRALAAKVYVRESNGKIYLSVRAFTEYRHRSNE
jgi:hypothetical protein